MVIYCTTRGSVAVLELLPWGKALCQIMRSPAARAPVARQGFPDLARVDSHPVAGLSTNLQAGDGIPAHR